MTNTQESINNEQIVKCDICDIKLTRNKYRYHLKTELHKLNTLIATEFDNIYIINTALKTRIISYCVKTINKIYSIPEDFLCENEMNIYRLVELNLQKHKCLKIQFELFAFYLLPKTNEKQLKSFNMKYEIIHDISEFKYIYRMKTIETMKRKLAEFEHSQSGWTFLSISHLEMNINKYSPLRGGTYIKLPPRVGNTKSCINVKNNDEFCFLWSILAGLYPCHKNSDRCSSYPHVSNNNIFNVNGMKFPPSFQDIKIFEKNNSNISINVFGLDNRKKNVTGPLYMTASRKINHFNLLYIENNGKGHYCLIKDLLKLVRSQVTKHKGDVFLCEACLMTFSSKNKYKKHYCSKVLQVLPNPNTYLMFKNFERQQKIPFIIYADFESLLENYSDNLKNTNTTKFKIHKPSCFAYYICCSFDSSLNKFVSYRGSDVTEVFIKKLMEDVEYINDLLISNKPMIHLTKKQQSEYDSSVYCHICKHFLFGDKVRDHDHVTGEYRGAAHSYCNLMFKVCSFIPVVFHNLCNYDLYLFIMELTKYDGSINVIPRTKEKYITITKSFRINENKPPVNVKFIDSFLFLNASLDKLSKSLNDNDFIHTSKFFNTTDQFDLMRKKGIYPYDYMSSFSKYLDESLPPKELFYNSLLNQHISDSEYRHAQRVWKQFNINDMGEYTDLYLKCDILLLTDIFENFRNMSLHYFKLDPAYYVTAPGFSWDAMLLYTDVRLELITDLEIYQMIEKGIRGGLAQCSLRHAEANNKYLPNFDHSKPSSYLIYLDCNNLYGFAMMKKMPISDFKFLSPEQTSNLNFETISDDSEYGYILEVDLEYPYNLHGAHCDLPLCVEKLIPPGGKSEKLVANLYNKTSYVIHYIHLKECLKQGLVLKKIYRVITFRQDSFLKKYIDLNTSLRQSSKSDFEKDFFKLLNNSIFGKTIENKRKQVNVKLVSEWEDNNNVTNKRVGARKLIAKPNLKSVSIFSENFLAIQLSLEKITLNKPIYVGFTVLEYAKTHLYQFHYNYIKSKFGDNAKLCYTDTDSLLYLIYTDDVYEDIKQDIQMFDTSNFDKNNSYGIPRVNTKKPGLFKDEMGGTLITEFVGLRAKLYCIKTTSEEIKKVKGVSKSVTKSLNIEHYSDCLLNDNDLKCKMNTIKSLKHTLYSQEVNKLVLNRNDDKRKILANQVDTVAWGHFAHTS